MEKMSRIAVIALAAGVFASCGEKVQEVDTGGVALNVDGREIYKYDEKNWQTVYFSPDNLFLMTTDSGDKWYRLSCDAFPSEVGQVIKADLTYRFAGSREGVKTVSGLSLKVSEIDGETGMVSLADSEKKVSLSIMCVI